MDVINALVSNMSKFPAENEGKTPVQELLLELAEERTGELWFRI